MLRKTLKAIIVLAGFNSLAGVTLADSNYLAIQYTPSGDNLIWTSFVEYSLKPVPNTSFPYLIYEYRWQCKRPCIPDWTDMTGTPTNPTESCYEMFVGTFEIRCIFAVGELPGGDPPPNPNYIVDGATITIPPPDGVALVSPDGALTQPGDSCVVVFEIRCKGKVCSMATGEPVEKITNIRVFDKKKPDNDWVPAEGVVSPVFKLVGGGRIEDTKNLETGPKWYTYPNVAVMTAKQEIGIRVWGPCGTKTLYPLQPAFNITASKDFMGSYRFNHSEILP